MSDDKIIKQDGKTYRQDWKGDWKPDTDWKGDPKVETDWKGDPKIETDWKGDQKIETDWKGDPIVPPDKTSDSRSGGGSSGGSSSGSGGGGSSGCCFTATACFRARGLPDDCLELTTLRRFRDEFVRRLPGGPQLIEQYYLRSPQIVAQIERDVHAEQIFAQIYSDIKRAVRLISEGKLDEAYYYYREVFRGLCARYAVNRLPERA